MNDELDRLERDLAELDTVGQISWLKRFFTRMQDAAKSRSAKTVYADLLKAVGSAGVTTVRTSSGRSVANMYVDDESELMSEAEVQTVLAAGATAVSAGRVFNIDSLTSVIAEPIDEPVLPGIQPPTSLYVPLRRHRRSIADMLDAEAVARTTSPANANTSAPAAPFTSQTFMDILRQMPSNDYLNELNNAFRASPQS